MNIILQNLICVLKFTYTKVKYLYIYHFKLTVALFEYLVLILLGEEILDQLWTRWYIAVNFYTDLGYLGKKYLSDKLDTLVLTVIWKIKRSSNTLIKLLCNYLNKYEWFKNNLIKF